LERLVGALGLEPRTR